MRFRAYPDCTSSSAVFYARIPSCRYITLLREHLDHGTFVDVGANVGLMTMLLADKVRRAILFEPNPLAASRARENLALNHLPFEVHELALSDAAGMVEFEDLGGVSSCNRTVTGFASNAPTITVTRTSFDEFQARAANLCGPVTAVKIDVEGHENSVLRGMRKLLEGDRPKLVLFEYLQRTDIRETFAIFASVRYRVFRVSSDGTTSWATDQVQPLQDLFACPEELATQFVC